MVHILKLQVKVAILKAMNSCINGFIPPVMSMLVNSERMEENSVELMGKVSLAVFLLSYLRCLSDMIMFLKSCGHTFLLVCSCMYLLICKESEYCLFA